MLFKNLTYLSVFVLILISLSFQKTRDVVYSFSADFFYPFLSFSDSVRDSAANKSLLTMNKDSLIEEIISLKRENIELAAKCAYLTKYKRENSELKKLLEIKSTPDYRYLYSEIILRDPVKWEKQFVINKGSDDGVESGALVVAPSENSDSSFAVVGRIGNVSGHTAVVYTIMSNECKLSVSLPENGATGIIQGANLNNNELYSIIHYLPKDLIYHEKSEVTTSGLSAVTPGDVPVGVISEIVQKNSNLYNSLYVTGYIKPFLSFGKLNFVLVLVKE